MSEVYIIIIIIIRALLNMSSKKRVKKSARKQAESAQTPTWLFDKIVTIDLKREVEDGLARHLVDNGIAVGSAKFKALALRDIIPSLTSMYSRWSAVEPGMINAATQPAVKALAAHLQGHKKGRKMVIRMVADLKAAGGPEQTDRDGSQSSQGGAEESEEEEAQADDSGGERTAQQPAYAKGNPAELLPEAAPRDGVLNADGQSGQDGVLDATQLVERLVGGLSETIRAQQAAEGSAGRTTQLRITAGDVRRWVEVGERVKRIRHYVQELDKEEDAVLELIRDTPLAYNWEKVKELHAASQQSIKSHCASPDHLPTKDTRECD